MQHDETWPRNITRCHRLPMQVLLQHLTRHTEPDQILHTPPSLAMLAAVDAHRIYTVDMTSRIHHAKVFLSKGPYHQSTRQCIIVVYFPYLGIPPPNPSMLIPHREHQPVVVPPNTEDLHPSSLSLPLPLPLSQKSLPISSPKHPDPNPNPVTLTQRRPYCPNHKPQTANHRATVIRAIHFMRFTVDRLEAFSEFSATVGA
jgi:hypothetical protein